MPTRRIDLLLFATTLIAFAWFHQGGGWNQNSRFAEVRAIVEQGRFAIDDFLIYREKGDGTFERLPIDHGAVVLGHSKKLSWVDGDWNLLPVTGGPALTRDEAVPIFEVAASGDVSYARDHFHPNKPPGTSLLAVPAYFVIYHVERLLGANPDARRTLNLNAWLTTIGSVGLVSALGSVLFFRVALHLVGDPRAAVLATLAYSFGTLVFPFGTMLFDHNLTATALLAAFYFIQQRALAAAGAAVGFAAITNYLAAIPVILFALHILWTHRSMRPLALFSLGVLGPFLVICAYNIACFGSPFAIANDFQNPIFAHQGPALFGMFGIPTADIALMLLVSPLRGIFYSSPVLLAGLYGLVKMSRRREKRSDALLFTAICAFFYVANATFYGWHAGFSAGSRYLIPAIPFLALPIAFAFRDFSKITAALAAISIFIQLAFTATDAQSPVGIGSHARVGDRSLWAYDPLTHYALPLLFTGRAWPLLHAQLDALPANERSEAKTAIDQAESTPLLLGAITGPVSVNPISMTEGMFFAQSGPDSPTARRASFNLGEFLFPGSLWSLAPLLALCAASIASLLLLTRRCIEHRDQ